MADSASLAARAPVGNYRRNAVRKLAWIVVLGASASVIV
jgi:hypothetical protein